MENAMPMYRVANSSKAPLKKELLTKQGVSSLSSRGTGTAASSVPAPIKKELPTKQGTESAGKAEAAKAASAPITKELSTKQGTGICRESRGRESCSSPDQKGAPDEAAHGICKESRRLGATVSILLLAKRMQRWLPRLLSLARNAWDDTFTVRKACRGGSAHVTILCTLPLSLPDEVP